MRITLAVAVCCRSYTGPECVGPSPTCQPPLGLRKGDCAGELDVSVEIEEVTTGGNDVLMQMLVSCAHPEPQ